MSDDQQIRDGERIQAFLSDDAVKAAILRTEQKYATDWRTAETVEAREACHAKITVLTDVMRELAGTVEDGKRATAKRQREQLVREQEQRNRPKR